MDLTANPNTFWMSIFVDELARNGMSAVCVAPGSRSTPLAIAFAAQPNVRVYRHLDERSASYFALGLSMATRRPVALVCTSGTAAANFHPAVIEAYYSHVPLLVLTADRPKELRGSGANQTIDQVKMYGDHVRWSVEVPTPQADASEVVLRHLRTLAARACAVADGVVKGPVHLNFPFRKPLEPLESTNGITPKSRFMDAVTSAQPFTRISHGIMTASESRITSVADLITTYSRGFIICGPEHADGGFPDEVSSLAKLCGYPILADSLSNLRFGAHVAGGYVIGGFHNWLPAADGLGTPEIILRFGAVATSSALATFLETASPLFHIHVREDGEWSDDQHLTHEFIQADPAQFCVGVSDELKRRNYRAPTDWPTKWLTAEAQGWEQLDRAMSHSPFFDGMAVNRVLAELPNGAGLFTGNSLPVRHIDAFARPSERQITIYGNRGASGIDGNVSTALGLAASGKHKHIVAILGDITFYHDMNGLMAISQNDLDKITFVVINNNGGGIFRRLPIAQYDPPFTELFLTPHGMRFNHAAAMYGLLYRSVTDERGLVDALEKAFEDTGRPSLIEVQTNSEADYRLMRGIVATVAAGFKPVMPATT